MTGEEGFCFGGAYVYGRSPSIEAFVSYTMPWSQPFPSRFIYERLSGEVSHEHSLKIQSKHS